MISVGDEVAGYRVLAPIGAGSMGSVWRVEQVERATVHALKFLPVSSRADRERLFREADMLVRLSHPNIVAFVEWIEIDRDPAIVMEFVEGKTLADFLSRGRPPTQVAEDLFLQIAAGVLHAHHRGIVHRDLKPSNILVTDRPGGGFVVKLADFGVARVWADAGDSGPDGSTFGSPPYMAPEQIREEGPVDARADVFALGCVLYELVAGRRAFPQAETNAVIDAILAGAGPGFDDYPPETPHRFRRAILGALATDPRRRTQTVEALIDAVTEGGMVTPVTPTERLHAPGRQAGQIPMIEIAVFALIIGALLAALLI